MLGSGFKQMKESAMKVFIWSSHKQNLQWGRYYTLRCTPDCHQSALEACGISSKVTQAWNQWTDFFSCMCPFEWSTGALQTCWLCGPLPFCLIFCCGLHLGVAFCRSCGRSNGIYSCGRAFPLFRSDCFWCTGESATLWVHSWSARYEVMHPCIRTLPSLC